MYRRILVPIDLADVELAKPAVATALTMARAIRRCLSPGQRLAGDAGDAC